MDSSTIIDEIDRLHSYADDVLGAARHLPNGTGDEVAKAAQAMVVLARQPITIGMVGEFSAGKSLLLGLLLGAPELLPVSDDATTANVTALHLTQGADDQPTTIQTATVHYLSPDELAACLDHLLAELAERATAAGLAAQAVAQLRTLAPEALWPQLEQWCRTAAWPARNPRLTLLVRELMRLRDAVVAAPSFLSWTTSVTSEVFREALLLPRSDPDPAAFPQPQAPVPGLSTRPASLAPQQLRATLPLVERVVLDVRVSRQVWDLSRLCGHNQLALLDFPGLNSTISGVRDRYLSRRELADVTTIFILLNAQAAGSDGPAEFPTMLQRDNKQLRDSVLIGVGRFDQLPNLINADLYDGTARLTERKLVDDVLSATMSNARLLVGTGQDERVHFHSAMIGIDALNRERPGQAHYSAEFDAQRRLAEHIPRARAEAAKWSRIVSRLAVDDPGSTLRPALAAFAADGGVRHIRQQLENHVTEHGLSLRLANLKTKADELERMRLRLVETLRRQGAGEDAGRVAARERIEGLLESAHHHLQEIKDQATLELAAPELVRTSDGASLTEAVRSRAVAEVFAWPEWPELFNAVQDGVVATRTYDPYVISDDDEDDDLAAPGLPENTEEFANRFAEAVASCERYAMQQAWQALTDWIWRVNAQLAPVREARGSVIDAEAERRIQEQFGDKDYPRALARSLDLSWLPGRIQTVVERSLAEREGGSQVDPVAAFPLRRHAGFVWSPAAPQEVSDAAVATLARHQIRPARLRRELVNGVLNIVLVRVGILQSEIARYVVRTVENRLTQLAKSSRFVEVAVGCDDPADADPAATLAMIKRPVSRG